MRPQRSLRPDLCDCVLEDRSLLASYIWKPLPFLPINNASNALVVPGFSTTGSSQGSSTVNSGANAYFLLLGINTNIYGLVGQSTVVVPTGFALALSSVVPPGAGPSGGLPITVGSGAEEASAAGGRASNRGYGANFNAGYATALNSLNSYGMNASPVGAMAASTSGDSSPDQSDMSAQGGTSGGSPSPSSRPEESPAPALGLPPIPGLTPAVSGPAQAAGPFPSPFQNPFSGPASGPANR
jgi:hypothetical protein